MIDAGDALVGIDEEPFPIEGGNLDGDGLDLRSDRLARIEVMRSDPGHAANQEHRHQRDRPDEDFNTTGINKLGPKACATVGRAKPKRDPQRRKNYRDHDRQHDAERVEQDLPFGDGDGSLRIEDTFVAAAKRGGTDQGGRWEKVPHARPRRADPEQTARLLKLARWGSSLSTRWLPARPITGGRAPAAPPMTLSCGVWRFSHIVYMAT